MVQTGQVHTAWLPMSSPVAAFTLFDSTPTTSDCCRGDQRVKLIRPVCAPAVPREASRLLHLRTVTTSSSARGDRTAMTADGDVTSSFRAHAR
jgi:hypothetical protein